MKKNVLVALALGAFAALVYFLSLANYAFPGESAHLQAVWRGLDTSTEILHPLMAVFARAFGAGNAFAPVCGILAVLLVYALVVAFLRPLIVGEASLRSAPTLARIAGTAAALVFLLTPAVRGAATHLEPRLFDALWALALFALFIPLRSLRLAPRLLLTIVLGAVAALGLCDSALFILLLPFVILTLALGEINRGKKPFAALTLFAFAFLVTFFVAVGAFDLELTELLKGLSKELGDYWSVTGWFFVTVFATVPFAISIFSAPKAFNEAKPGLVTWLYHIALSVIVILAVATPLSPSSLLAEAGVLPVVTSAYVAMVAGYLVAFWWFHRAHAIAAVSGIVLVFAVGFASLWNLFIFESDRGAFADAVASKIIDDLGPRTWFVTDGLIDDHLRLVAQKRGKELNIISLARDLETPYLTALGKVVREKKLGGSKNESLALSLTLGVLPFVQDWFSSDPSVPREAAIFGAPDLWYSAGFTPVPEFLFFGADKARTCDAAAWATFDKILHAPEGWGSYHTRDDLDPVERLRLNLRRHLGFVANNRGVYLQDQKKDDEAFALYEKVLTEIDSDNVCALFNEIEMAGQKYPKALAKKAELERLIKTIVDDKNRRYLVWRLGTYYGYIRNPDMFIRLGFSWARSGRPGDALVHIRRAIDFVPADKRMTLLNMMAALYADENDQQKSRRIYQALLKKNANDHDALVGMMRLELLNGDAKKALDYLQRAISVSSGEGKRAQIELSMVALMKNDLKGAEARLTKVTDGEPKDMQAWSLLAAVKMQEYDETKDEKAREAIMKDIAGRILPAMEKSSDNPYDYYLQITKAFLLMRQGAAKRREARDAFVVASRARPASVAAQDLILGLDISLDDKENAERHAREVLRRNRNAPLANYVMGSLAIQKGDYREAEGFLRKAVNTAEPTVLALNDLAETLRRNKNYPEAETYAVKATEKAPEFYLVWETLGIIQLERGGDIETAEKNIRKAIVLSKDKAGDEDMRIYTSLARVQLKKGDVKSARSSLRRVQPKLKDLTEFERREYEEILQRVR